MTSTFVHAKTCALYMVFVHRISWERLNSKNAQEVTAVCILFAPSPSACSTASSLPFPGNVATYPPYLHILFVSSLSSWFLLTFCLIVVWHPRVSKTNLIEH